MAPARRWRVGVAGLARAGIWRRVRAWLADPRVELVAAGDGDGGRRRRALALGVPRVYRSPRELLSRESLDLVHIAANPGRQGALIRSALMRGLDVVVELPVTADLAELAKVVAASKTYGGLLIPLWPSVFDPPWLGAPGQLARIGRPHHLEVVQVAGLDPWWEELAYELADDPQLPVPTLTRLAAFPGVALALELFGAPEAVAAQEAPPGPGALWGDGATLILTFPQATARVRVVWAGQRQGPTFILYGTEGRLEGRGLRLILEGPGGRSTLGLAPPSSPWEPVLQAVVDPASLPRSLSLAHLQVVAQVLAGLDASAAAAGRLQPLAHRSRPAASGRQ